MTYICLYGIISFVMLVVLAQDNLSRVTVGIASRELVTVSVVLVLIVVVSEMMFYMWDCFEKDIFRQNRALEDLNEVNDKMKEQQEKINRVNEKLGVQKSNYSLQIKRLTVRMMKCRYRMNLLPLLLPQRRLTPCCKKLQI